MTLQISSSGQTVENFSAAQPLKGVGSDHSSYVIAQTGTATGVITTTGDQARFVVTGGDASVSVQINGHVAGKQPATGTTTVDRYQCSATQLVTVATDGVTTTYRRN
jgi:hypothetical protein